MSSSIGPLRRFAVTSALIGAAVFGSVALAPAASADESAPVVEQVPAPESAPVVEVAPAPAPAPAAAPAPAPAPVVTAPPIAYDKNGKPIKHPKACTAKELEKAQKDAAQSLKLADALNAAALTLREASGKLRAQAITASASSARVLGALANASDTAAQLLENKAAALIDAAYVLPCIPPGGGRF